MLANGEMWRAQEREATSDLYRVDWMVPLLVRLTRVKDCTYLIDQCFNQ